LLHLVELLQAEEDAEAVGMTGLIHWLVDRRGAGTEAAEEAQLRLESDENLVKIPTIHKSKGLQYPLVFCPFLWDVPLRDKDEGLGILFHDPDEDDQVTLDAGSERIEEARALAEREALAENLRLAYVAITRAEHRGTVVWGNINGGELSGLAYLLHQPAEPARGSDPVASVRARAKALDDREVLADLTKLARRAAGAIAVERLSPSEPLGTGPSAPVPVSLQARRFAGKIPKGWQVTSFSGLTTGSHREASDYDAAPSPERGSRPALPGQAPPDIADFPRGVRPGIFMHTLFASLDFARADRAAVEVAVARALREHGFDEAWETAVADMAEKVLQTPLDAATDLCLARVGREERLDELTFHYPVFGLDPGRLTGLLRTHGRDGAIRGQIRELAFDPVRGYMTGSMDLVFEAGGRYYLADYKSNWLGEGPDAYRAERLPQVMARETYDLQYLIYTVALTRYLSQRLPEFRYERDFGGVFYLFLRGMDPARGPDFGVYRDRPSKSLIVTLDRYLAQGEAA
jgi:exodeoxyribonuclease V beta subunit